MFLFWRQEQAGCQQAAVKLAEARGCQHGMIGQLPGELMHDRGITGAQFEFQFDKFDLAGRVYSGVPAPSNLRVPPYRFVRDDLILIGQDTGAA